MEASNSSRPLWERPEFQYGKFIVKKDPKLRLKEVIYSDRPCVSCGGRIEKNEVYEQDVYVTACFRRRAPEESGGKTEESSLQPRSSKMLENRRKNELADVGPGVRKTAGDSKVRKRGRKDRGNEKDRKRRKRQAEARSRKIAGVTKKEWDQLKKYIRGQMD